MSPQKTELKLFSSRMRNHICCSEKELLAVRTVEKEKGVTFDLPGTQVWVQRDSRKVFCENSRLESVTRSLSI